MTDADIEKIVRAHVPTLGLQVAPLVSLGRAIVAALTPSAPVAVGLTDEQIDALWKKWSLSPCEDGWHQQPETYRLKAAFAAGLAALNATPPAKLGPETEAVGDAWRHPMQPLAPDEQGVMRFRRNAIVDHLLEWSRPRGMGLNELRALGFADDEWQQFAQLIGYSLNGWGTLSFVSDEAYARATPPATAQDAGTVAGDPAEPKDIGCCGGDPDCDAFEHCSGHGQLDPRTALEQARTMVRYCQSFNGQPWGGIDESVDRQNLAVALDNLEETASMLLNMAGRVQHIAAPSPASAPATEVVSRRIVDALRECVSQLATVQCDRKERWSNERVNMVSGCLLMARRALGEVDDK